ncbi:MAG: ISAs1 family transposase [Gemmataceae bacterium]
MFRPPPRRRLRPRSTGRAGAVARRCEDQRAQGRPGTARPAAGQGTLLSGDALFCQRDFCKEVIDQGGDYVLTVKDNQPSLAVDIAAGLAFDEQKRRQAAAFPPRGVAASGNPWRGVDKGHGRLEVRTLRLTSTLTKTQDWTGLKQGFELVRERTEKGVKSVEVVYGITSLGREQADAARLLGLVREHWGIENGCHYRRDVTLGEDASRVRGQRPGGDGGPAQHRHPSGPRGGVRPGRGHPHSQQLLFPGS